MSDGDNLTLNERVIEVAARGIHDCLMRRMAPIGQDKPFELTGIEWQNGMRDYARAAIFAADEGRADAGYVLVRREDLRRALTALEVAAEQVDTHNLNTRFTPEIDPPFLDEDDRAVMDRLTAALGDGAHGTEGE